MLLGTLFIFCFAFYAILYPLLQYIEAFENATKLTINKSQSTNEEINKVQHFTQFANFSNLPNVQLTRENNNKTIADRSNQCQLYGIRVSDEDKTDIDCTKLCNSNKVYYKFMKKNSLLINNAQNTEGGYCLPLRAAHCNETTAQAILTEEGWSCQSKYRLFGGTSGHEIITCGGVIRDNLLLKTYIDTIPNSVTFDNANSIIKDGPMKGQPRFVCGVALDNKQNPLINPNSGDPYEQIGNFCTSMIYNAPLTIFPNFENGNCLCNNNNNSNQTKNIYQNYEPYNLQTPCVKCKSGFVPKNSKNDIKSMHTYALHFSRLCIKANDTINNLAQMGPYSNNHMPCGVSSFSNKTDKCQRGIILINNENSPYMKAALS